MDVMDLTLRQKCLEESWQLGFMKKRQGVIAFNCACVCVS